MLSMYIDFVGYCYRSGWLSKSYVLIALATKYMNLICIIFRFTQTFYLWMKSNYEIQIVLFTCQSWIFQDIMCLKNMEQVDAGGVCLYVIHNLCASPFELEASHLFSESVVVCCCRWHSKANCPEISSLCWWTELSPPQAVYTSISCSSD